MANPCTKPSKKQKLLQNAISGFLFFHCYTVVGAIMQLLIEY